MTAGQVKGSKGEEGRRSYRSAVREEQAAATRARIVEAAAELFGADGYGRVTIRRIAEHAGVAPDTVYAIFGSKIRVLTAIIDARLVPAGEPQVTERPGALAVRDEPDQRRQLALFATDLADIVERLGPAYEMLRTAAAVEPEAGAVYAEMNGYRLVNMTRVAQWIAARGPLRMTVDEAAGTIWTLASPDVARLLRDGRGMSKAEYARWLEDALVRVLLPD